MHSTVVLHRVKGDTSRYVIDSVANFIATIVKHCPNHEWAFRGQPEDWDLLPKAYRPEFQLSEGNGNDLERFERWRDQAIAFDENFPRCYLEQLALAQHYGLATRLMDWTANAVIALYFATEYRFENESGTDHKDGAVYLYRKKTGSTSRLLKSKERLEECEDVLFYRPRLVNRRILAQDGLFTVHPKKEPMNTRSFAPEETKDASDGTVMKMFVPGSRKEDLQYDLRAIGIQARTAYPDLEGLSKSTNWQTNWLVKSARGRKAE